jgi:hypothetical protein
MFGVVTRHAGDREIPEFQRTYFEAKDVSGRASAPIEDAINTIAARHTRGTGGGCWRWSPRPPRPPQV